MSLKDKRRGISCLFSSDGNGMVQWQDREIDGLNEQMDEDARLLQHLQVQLVEEKRKRVEAEREKEALQQQVAVLTNMLSENQTMDEEEYEFYNENSQGLGGNDHEVQWMCCK